MNERMNELLKQADMGYLFRKGEMLPGMVNPESLDKFAELIVKECAELCSDLDGGENMFSRGIRKHFGVEE